MHEIALQNKDGNYWTTSASIAQGGVQSAAEEALKTGVMPDDPAADFGPRPQATRDVERTTSPRRRCLLGGRTDAARRGIPIPPHVR